MHLAELETISLRHRTAPIPFDYSKDAYATRLLELAIGGGRPLSVVRRSPFAQLLEKPIVRRALARLKGAILTPSVLASSEPERAARYRMTFGCWGSMQWDPGYHQTSRPGFNLVLQLNFPLEHDRAYRRLIRAPEAPFATNRHPVRTDEYLTLGWARLDVDLRFREALIEEVQSDWIHYAEAARREALDWLASGEPADLRPDPDLDASAIEILTYVESVLRPHAVIWHEAVLCAAIWFLCEELGIRRIFFHDYECGAWLKGASRALGPRSLYTDLPRRFCFRRTTRAPRFLSACPHPEVQRRLEAGVHWFALEPSVTLSA